MAEEITDDLTDIDRSLACLAEDAARYA